MTTDPGKDLLDRLLSSEVKADLLTLFHRNPGLVDSSDGIARRIGRATDEIDADVDDFLDMGLLKATQAGSVTLLRLNKEKDTEIQHSLAEYLKRRSA